MVAVVKDVVVTTTLDTVIHIGDGEWIGTDEDAPTTREVGSQLEFCVDSEWGVYGE